MALVRDLFLFLVRDVADYYTVVIEGDREKAAEILRSYYPEVRYIKKEKLTDKEMRKYEGNRVIGDCIIRGCWFTRQLRTFSKYSKPIEADYDPRYDYEDVA